VLTVLSPNLLFAQIDALVNPVKKAQKYIKKQQADKARAYLEKQAIKHPENFAFDYLYSQYYLLPDIADNDSSYIFLLSAIDKFEASSTQRRTRYIKLGIDSVALYRGKEIMDSLAFLQAEKINSEYSYQAFRVKYTTAKQVPEAIRRRNRIAFAEAKAKNTYEAYLAFLDKYPEAEEAKSAKELVDLILFERTAQGGRLQNWVEFIQKNPNNPYLSKAEDRVYEILTAEHTPAVYYKFIQQHPNNPNVMKAWHWIVYLEKGLKQKSQLSTKYPGFPEDSFARFIEYRNFVLFPVIQKNKFGFINQDGHEVLTAMYDSIPEDYKCEFNTGDFYKVFSKRKVSIYTIDERLVSGGEYDDAYELLPGCLAVKKNKLWGLISLYGDELHDCRFDSIYVLRDNLLIGVEKGKLSLLTAKGQRLNLNQQDNFVALGNNHILVFKDRKGALLNNEDIFRRLENYFIQPNYKYNKYKEFLGDEFLLFSNQEVDIIKNDKFSTILNTGADDGERTPWGYSFRHGAVVELTDSNGKAMTELFEYAKVFPNFAIVRIRGHWGVINREGQFKLEAVYDSISHITDRCLLVKNQGLNTILWDLEKELPIKGLKQPEVLWIETQQGHKKQLFIVFSDSTGRKGLYNSAGKQLLKHAYEQITMVNENLFSFKQNNKVGVADTNGNILLRPIFDAVGPLTPLVINVVKNQKFDLFYLTSKKATDIGFEALLKLYAPGTDLLIATKNGKTGLVDFKGKTIVPFQFDDLIYWNEQTALVQIDLEFFFYNIAKKEMNPRPYKNRKELSNRNGEIMMMVETEGKYGLISNRKGQIIPAESEEILPIYLNDDLYFFTSRKIIQSTNYNIAYYNSSGKLIRTQIVSDVEYDKIVCD
jgi:hypothetical protein